MKFKYGILFSLGLIILLISCKQENEETQETSFHFSITNELTGEITSQEGTISLECKEDRIVLFFKETIEGRTDSADLLIGEIIFGFQKGDTIGVYPLNEISGKRENGKVGIVAFLDLLEYDELAKQYISNPVRYERVQNGSVEITEWSTEIGGMTKGKLNTKLGERGNKVKIKGEFIAKWNVENINCDND